MKLCPKCNIQKEHSLFYRNHRTLDGFDYTCKLCKSLVAKRWRETNVERLAANKKKWYEENKDKAISYAHEYYEKNKDKIIPKIVKYRLSRMKTDPLFKLRKTLCHRVGKLVKQQSSSIALNFLGCELEDFKKYMESQFQPGMTWDNHGQWHIDHIKPLASFDLNNVEELKKACHYTNLQPLWAKDNLYKGDRLV